MSKLFLVAKFEYLRTVKKPAFWFTTLFLPVFMVIVMMISVFSSSEGERKLEELSEEIDSVLVVDKAGIINHDLIVPPLYVATNKEESIKSLKAGDVDAVIVYSDELLEENKFEVYAPEQGLLGSTPFTTLGGSLAYQSSLLGLENPRQQQILSGELSEELIIFDKDGAETSFGIEKFIVPIVSIIIFFLSVFIGAGLLLQSVSEEKENRMIETLLSMIKPKTLIYGKIFGLSGAVLTQLSVWVCAAGILLLVGFNNELFTLPIELSNIPLGAIPINLYFTFMGFLFFAAIMVGVGSITTNYKESSSMSSVFIILGIMPMYFILILLSDPNGVIAQITSYFPFTAPMIFVIRNSVTDLLPTELLLGIVLVFVYVVIAFFLALKLFDLGALMNNRKPSLKEIIYTLKKN
ncbi:MAG: ABC transporter permease [Candidatus Dojkabacteria bacterium]